MDTNIWFNLSERQLNIWDLEQRYKGTSMNVISCAIEIFARVDFSLLEQVLNEVLASDDSLRLRIRADENGPMQRYVSYDRQQFVRYDFTQSGRDAFEKWKEMAAREPLPLYESPLCQFFLFRLGEHEGGIFVRTHHIILDGWTQTQLCNRIAARYMELLGASAAAMDAQPSYQLHIENEKAYLESYQKERDARFWKDLLAKDLEAACIKQEKSAVSSLCGMRVSYGFSELLSTLRMIVDAKDAVTRGHSDRVAYYAEELGKALGAEEEVLHKLRIGGLFHDIGKIAVADEILQKPDSITEHEYEEMKKHPLYGENILSEVSQLKDVLPIVRGHHERVDGTGYPDGLIGEEISFETRVVTVADSFDAMFSDRRYHVGQPLEEVLAEMEACKGTQFDPHIVDVFIQMLREHPEMTEWDKDEVVF